MHSQELEEKVRGLFEKGARYNASVEKSNVELLISSIGLTLNLKISDLKLFTLACALVPQLTSYYFDIITSLLFPYIVSLLETGEEEPQDTLNDVHEFVMDLLKADFYHDLLNEINRQENE